MRLVYWNSSKDEVDNLKMVSYMYASGKALRVCYLPVLWCYHTSHIPVPNGRTERGGGRQFVIN